MSLRDSILDAAKKSIFEEVDTPFGKVRVKALRGSEFDRITALQSESEQNALLVVLTTYELDKDERVFDDDCIGVLANGNTSAIYPLVTTAKRLMVLAGDAQKKPSTTTDGTKSGIDSPA